MKTVENCRSNHVNDWLAIKNELRSSLSSFLFKQTKRSPMILPVLLGVPQEAPALSMARVQEAAAGRRAASKR